MEARVAKLEAIIPTLATKQDLAELELRFEKSLHSEINLFRQEVNLELGLIRQEVNSEFGLIRHEICGIHKGMAELQKTISAQLMKAIIIMITISMSLSGVAIAIASK
jgi:hypothetical protein